MAHRSTKEQPVVQQMETETQLDQHGTCDSFYRVRSLYINFLFEKYTNLAIYSICAPLIAIKFLLVPSAAQKNYFMLHLELLLNNKTANCSQNIAFRESL